MKEVFKFIEVKKQEFAKLPFCEFLQDKSIDPRQRLAWAPCLAPFVMNIWEVNKYFLREEPTSDPIQKIINKHTYEDDHHYVWYLEDMEKLAFDYSSKFSDSLRFLWGKETQRTRQICQKIAAYSFQAEPILKFAIIEVIEATGNVVLSLTTEVSRELEISTKHNYRYFGEHHLAVETGHTTGTDDIEILIENIELPEATRKKAFWLVEKVFEAFADGLNEFYLYAKSHPIEPPLHDINLAQNHQSITAQKDESLQALSQDKHLGYYLVEAGLLTPEQVEVALSQQKRTGIHFNEVITSNNWINHQTVEYIIEKVIMPEQEIIMAS
ncbi:hypothetical protein PCC6912_35700 [Chlorogloeopsis fritschii PCC 6912]|uniref:Uncharacterized protein n=1 Tax=Chlorogloeopsis fritschii PCC 6912 TaxID=211165 RepID=A0A3S1FGX2_CHLFR|nr:hypothetical protein [Chlorogloeopsis fritschii]RUR78228.1 hypothetical protein PCC6912_35700 [Chlorogloeopsis fritschii PCC 6912]